MNTANKSVDSGSFAAMKSLIAELGCDLEIDGVSNHTICPVCGGGDAKEKSFQVRKSAQNKLGYICYRASCSIRGIAVINSGQLFTAEKQPVQPKLEYTVESTIAALTEHQRAELHKKIHIRTADCLRAGIRIARIGTEQRVIYPLFDRHGRTVGNLLRRYPFMPSSTKTAKVLADMFEESCGPFYPVRNLQESQTLLVVEDWLSAYKLCSTGYRCCLLSGTNFTTAIVQKLVRQGIKNIIMILDADARNKSATAKLEFGINFRNFSLIPLSNLDVKDMGEEEFATLRRSIESQMELFEE